MFGPEGIEGEESFDMIVCTPAWIGRTMTDGMMIGRHHLIVRAFDIVAIKGFLNGYAATCKGKDWREVALKLARIGKWEFEDYPVG